MNFEDYHLDYAELRNMTAYVIGRTDHSTDNRLREQRRLIDHIYAGNAYDGSHDPDNASQQ